MSLGPGSGEAAAAERRAHHRRPQPQVYLYTFNTQQGTHIHSRSKHISSFSADRCDKERECRHDLEVEMNSLRLLDEELHVHTLPELQSVVSDQTQELMEMQIQHKQVKQ